jgi:hypothetical protein
MSDAEPYAGFIGTWLLIPESCEYEQGDPPQDSVYSIAEQQGRLTFDIRWTAADGRADHVTFEGVPDGAKRPFSGGDLADELSVEVVSPRDLRTAAYWQGRQRMVSQFQLDDTGTAMRVIQLVRFPDGSHLSNVSVYRRAPRG